MPCLFLYEQDIVYACHGYTFLSSLIPKAFRPFIVKL